MLKITIPKQTLWDEVNAEFIDIDETKLTLEHSLISIHKWEGIWHIPFLGNGRDESKKTSEQIMSYVKCMTLNNVKDEVYAGLTPENVKEITDYIANPMTAARFNDSLIGAQSHSGEYVSSETIYYWMIALHIPVEFEKWHLEQLLTLIKFVNAKETPEKKMSQQEWAKQRQALNAARKAKYKTKG